VAGAKLYFPARGLFLSNEQKTATTFSCHFNINFWPAGTRTSTLILIFN